MGIIGATNHTMDISRAEISPRSVTANTVLLLVVVFGIHTAFSLQSLPHQFLAFSAAAGLFLVNHRSFSPSLFFWFLVTFLVVATAGVASSLSGDEDFLANIRASLNFMYDLFIGINVYFAVISLGRAWMRKIFFYVLLFLIIGAALEVIGIVKPLSDAFRESTFATGLYTQNQRDLDVFGTIRPKFFSAEPAGLGETMSVSFFFWTTSIDSMKMRTKILALSLIAVCFFLVRSPILIFGLVAVILYYSIIYYPSNRIWRRLGSLFAISYGVITLSAPAIINKILLDSVEIPEYFSAGSFYARVIAPFYMAMESLDSRPLFGIGLSISETFVTLAIDAYTATGRLHGIPVVAWDTLAANSCSALWYTFIAFGLVGITGLIATLKMIFRAMQIRVPLSLVIFIAGLTFWLTFGRVNSPIAWETFFGVAAACDMGLAGRTVRQRSATSEPRSSLRGTVSRF